MGDFLTREDRLIIWAALSDVFVDNKVDYAAIAKALTEYDRTIVEHEFFNEVAPACYSNMQSAIPPIWTAFDSAWLEQMIASMKQARSNSTIRELRDRAFIVYLRWRLRPEWIEIERALSQSEQSENSA
ncbi:MAG: DUF7079 family protein [Pseudomonas sp.]|uniref:DUF7079 family protein n=1 Tax=Pseudomonas sp. TaxID=306 RepID=UPI003D0B6D33